MDWRSATLHPTLHCDTHETPPCFNATCPATAPPPTFFRLPCAAASCRACASCATGRSAGSRCRRGRDTPGAPARDRLERGLVDALVSAGSNASVLRSGLQAPVATIQLSGFDLLQALIKARRMSSRVGVVMYGQTIPELDEVKGLLNIEVVQHAYQTPDDARQRFEQLRREGFEVIVGSSLVVELA